jgi:hypothetical protein
MSNVDTLVASENTALNTGGLLISKLIATMVINKNLHLAEMPEDDLAELNNSLLMVFITGTHTAKSSVLSAALVNAGRVENSDIMPTLAYILSHECFSQPAPKGYDRAEWLVTLQRCIDALNDNRDLYKSEAGRDGFQRERDSALNWLGFHLPYM